MVEIHSKTSLPLGAALCRAGITAPLPPIAAAPSPVVRLGAVTPTVSLQPWWGSQRLSYKAGFDGGWLATTVAVTKVGASTAFT